MGHAYHTLDVFTRDPLTGNPLAVVSAAEDLDGARMQAIAREFNLSETVFLLPPRDARHRTRVRIFTPAVEMPFAGHPLIGTAALLALVAPLEEGVAAQAFALEAPIGEIPCVVEVLGADSARARLRLPRKPQKHPAPHDKQTLAAAFGLSPAEIGYARHQPSRYDAGATYDLVPVRSLAALAQAKPVRPAFDQAFPPPAGLTLLYTGAGEEDGADWRARMFAPGFGVEEDPATGSAAASLVGALLEFDAPGEGVHDVVIRQGVEMGRPSRIGLQLTVVEGALSHAELVGEAVIVSEGALRL